MTLDARSDVFPPVQKTGMGLRLRKYFHRVGVNILDFSLPSFALAVALGNRRRAFFYNSDYNLAAMITKG